MGTVIKNRGTSCVGVRKTGTTLIRVSTVMGTLYFLDAKLFKGGNVIWIPEKDSKKMIPKNTINLYGIAEGYYCNQCIKVVAIFEDRGADFLQ